MSQASESQDDVKHVRMRYAEGETGWAIDLGGGRYKIANVPMCDGLHFGDIVKFRKGVDIFDGDFRILEKGLDQKLAFRYTEKETFHAVSDRCDLDEFKDDVCLEGVVGPEKSYSSRGLALLGYNASVDVEALFKGISGVEFDIEEDA